MSPLLFNFQHFILDLWLEEFRGKLAIALSDVLSVPAFLADFSSQLAHAYNGIRIDSGDPIAVGEEVIRYYKAQGINPLLKTLIFSDSITFKKAIAIANHFKDRIQVVFGIGTYLTNDHGPHPLNIVIKMTSIDGQAVGKLTETPQKAFCLNPLFLQKLKELNAEKHALYFNTIQQKVIT